MILRLLVVLLTVAVVTPQNDTRALVAERVTRLTRDSPWKQVAAVPIAFKTFHPQGMVKIGETLYVSSVEVTVPTRRIPQAVDGHDRDTGAGVAHLFKVDMTGRLVAD